MQSVLIFPRPLGIIPGMRGSVPSPGKVFVAPVLVEREGGDPIAADWGRIEVPESPEKARGARIQLPFVRFRCPGAPKAPPVFFLNGGPGVEMGRSLRRAAHWFRGLAGSADLVIPEQRGIGDSRPRLECPGEFRLPLDRPLEFAQEVKAAAEFYSRAAKAWSSAGADPLRYNAREAAEDLDALRRALGYERISLCGGSFGSHWAMAALRAHGEAIERAVLTSVEGPDHTVKLPSAIQKCVEEVGRRAAADPALGGRVPDLLGLVRQILERLERAPAAMDVVDAKTRKAERIVVGRFDLARVMAEGLGSTAHIRGLPARCLAMEAGDFAWLGEQALRFRRPGPLNLMPAMADVASGATPGRWERIRREAGETLLGDAINEAFFQAREALGNPDLGDTFRSDLRWNGPVLLVSGTLDGRTPPSNAEEVLRGLPGGRHLLADGVSHDLGGRSEVNDRIFGIVCRFLLGENPPETRLEGPFEFDRRAR